MSRSERASAAIRWIERSLYLHEARVTTTGGGLYLTEMQDERRERKGDGPMDQSMGSERERDTQQQRADARERVHVAQEREASARAVRQSDARQRAAQRQQLATREARKPLVTDETPQPDVPDASGDEVPT